MQTYPNYHRALAGLAKVSAAEGHLAEAIELYKQAIGVIPLPAYTAALGDVYTKAGNSAEARKNYDLVEYIARLNAFNQSVYNRELAMFYADHDIHLPEALALARKEFEVRHDIYTWDALAWTLYKNAQPQEAAAAIKEALHLDTKDPLLLFHAGMIYDRLGEKARARGLPPSRDCPQSSVPPLLCGRSPKPLCKASRNPRSPRRPKGLRMRNRSLTWSSDMR